MVSLLSTFVILSQSPTLTQINCQMTQNTPLVRRRIEFAFASEAEHAANETILESYCGLSVKKTEHYCLVWRERFASYIMKDDHQTPFSEVF